MAKKLYILYMPILIAVMLAFLYMGFAVKIDYSEDNKTIPEGTPVITVAPEDGLTLPDSPTGTTASGNLTITNSGGGILEIQQIRTG